jgi:signal transduction histidine kinase/CheY-like chemotaxis protein
MQENLLSAQTGEQPLRKLFELSRRLVISLDLNDILQATVEGVSILTGLDSAAVYLIEKDKLRLCNTTPALSPEFPEEYRYMSIENFPYMSKSIQSAAPVYISDVEDVSLSSEERSICELRDIRTLLFLPLIAETEVMGALTVGSIGSAKPISDVQMDLSHTLANFAALAVKNARLYQAGQKHAAELQQTLVEYKRVDAERGKLQEELMHSQKMDAIGQLAGGIAHDFNNMLCGILGQAELIQYSTSDKEILELTRGIITTGRRSADLISQLLAFSRKGQIQIVPVNLHQIVEEVVSILRHTIDRKIEIKVDLDETACCTAGDPAQIQSTLLNLAVNARDAMPNGGELIIHTSCINLDTERCQLLTCEPVPGEYIELLMCDNGTGMDTATLERIYEPFFTTKKQGKGTGMGLSAVYGTMKSLDGAISVSSIPGQGTTFKLYFPLNTMTNKTESEIKIVHSGMVDPRKCLMRILIVDDEDTVAKITAKHLLNTGYKVEVYTDSLAALSFFKEQHSTISLIILDMVMPKMDGSSMFHALRAIDPGVRFILTSGFTDTGSVQALLNDGAQLFLQKPFQQDKLIEAVGKVLEG